MPIDLFPAAGLETEHLLLCPVSQADAAALLGFYLDNRSHLQPWEPLRDEAFYTLEGMAERLLGIEWQVRQGYALNLLLCDRNDGTIVGVCNFSNIVRGAFLACHLGYALAEAAQGKGLMREALRTAIDFMFRNYGLHRIMANYRPENERSARLLADMGFEIEGRARSYLKINGAWCDHVLTALINERE